MKTEEAFEKLARSPFRSRFHLDKKDIEYVKKIGLATLRTHAAEFVSTRLAPAVIPNDGKQTPMKGHPVFIAQHATACCCRDCLSKWYHVPKGVPLMPTQQEKIVNLLIAWIEREIAGK